MPPRRPALQSARRDRCWSQAQAARELAALAAARGGPGAAPASLKSLLSRWENGHATPEPQYRELLGELYGRTPAELELAAESAVEPEPATYLRGRLAAAAAIDGTLLQTWRDQLALARQLDEQVGAAGAAGVVRELVAQLDDSVTHALDPQVQVQLAHLLARSATLAGWQKLDMGAVDKAWQLFTRARTAARTAGPDADGDGAAAVAGLAAVLVELGDAEGAVALLDHASDQVGTAARAWLEAARGVALAARGLLDAARGSFADAERLLTPPQAPQAPRQSTPQQPGSKAALPTPADLRRWRDQALGGFGDTSTVSALEAALEAGLCPVRERAASHAALAVLLAADRPAAAAEHARSARRLADRIGSTRTIAPLTRT